jgi:hypothetical protein
MAFYRVLGEEVYIDRILYEKSNYLRTLFGGSGEYHGQ